MAEEGGGELSDDAEGDIDDDEALTPTAIGDSEPSMQAATDQRRTRAKPKKKLSLVKSIISQSSSPKNSRLRTQQTLEESPESAQFCLIINQKYKESVEQMLETSKSFFLQEF